MKKNDEPREILVWVAPEPKIQKYGRYSGDGEFLQYLKESVYVESSIENLIDRFAEVQKEYPNYTKFRIEAVNDCGCYNDCRCSPSHYFKGFRMEYPVEVEYREKKRVQQENQQKERERLEYERLKAKFGE